jgi:AcrR family transcriptional regulator
MANTIKFKPDEVVQRAMLLFWEKGFAGTSTRDLQQQVRLNPGSLYSAFGSKAGLYSQALDFYADATESRLLAAREQTGSYQGLCGSSERQAPMCLLVRTLVELADSQPELAAQAERLLKQTERLFARLLQEAVVDHELGPDTDVDALAKELQIKMMGLRSYRACGGDPAAIRAMIDALF